MDAVDALVLGGGAAGFFGAIRAAEGGARVLLLEATGTPLQKVRISGGGRCNVTHHQFDPAQLVLRYPRGAKELRSVFSRFGPRETMAWFEGRGVPLKVEPDGRVFPVSDDAETIIACLLDEAARAGVEVRLHETARTIRMVEGGFEATLKSGTDVRAGAVLLATGSNPQGWALARSLGHTVVPGVPSLFTFNVDDPRLSGLAGVSVPLARVTAVLPDGRKLAQEGPLLVTHWGLSAHAVLRISAWGARDLHATGYKARIHVDWAPEAGEEELRRRADALRKEAPRGTIGAHPLVDSVPRRLWERLIEHVNGDPATRWSEVPARGVNRLIEELKRGAFDVQGKGPFREEFVTAGGVERREVDWRTMESRATPGLHFSGEVLDVDALTGGFNFQNAWSTGWIAGGAIAERLTRATPGPRSPP